MTEKELRDIRRRLRKLEWEWSEWQRGWNEALDKWEHERKKKRFS